MIRILLAFAILSVATLAQAQQEPTGGYSQGSSGSAQRTVQGCLQGSDGSYTVTEPSGRSYSLVGDTWKLTPYIGREASISGTTYGAGSTDSTIGAEATGNPLPILNVHGAKQVSAQCGAGER